MKEIQLTREKSAFVDDEDYDWISLHKWTFNGKYAYRAKPRAYVGGPTVGSIILHREIMAAGPGQIVDHINRDPLDCRKCNMRFVNRSQSQWNRGPEKDTGFKGVNFRPARGTWVTRIMKDGKRIYVGSYKDEKSAAIAYNKAAILHYGEYAGLNIIN